MRHVGNRHVVRKLERVIPICIAVKNPGAEPLGSEVAGIVVDTFRAAQEFRTVSVQAAIMFEVVNIDFKTAAGNAVQKISVIPYAAVNHFWHAAHVMDATYRDGGCPNNDTLYSVAWLDLGEEPVILSHPDMGDRYFTFELMGFTSDTYDYVGQRTTGSKAGHFAICGPDWQGELPPGVRSVQPAPTPWILIMGRTLVDGDADLANVHVLQAQYRLTPLSLWGKPGAQVHERRDVYTPAEAAQDPLGPWKTLNAMLAENPPPPHHALVLNQFARIGIGPGLDVEAQPDVVKQGLARAAVTGMGLLMQQFLSGEWATLVNGWRYPPAEEGRFGDDFLQRAADQSLAGITANHRQRRSTWSTSPTPTAPNCPPRAATSCISAPVTFPRWTRSGPWPPTPPRT